MASIPSRCDRRSLLVVPDHRPERIAKALPADVTLLANLMDEAGMQGEIGALIEICAGIDLAADCAKASPRVSFLMFDGGDLSAELGVALARTPLQFARARIVQAAAQA